MTSADLRSLAVFLKNRPAKAKIATWGANQVDMLANWQAVAQDQMAQQSNSIKDLQAQIASLQTQVANLQAQLAAAPTALVLLGTHLHGFTTSVDADAFILANSNQTPTKFDTTDFTWHRTT